MTSQAQEMCPVELHVRKRMHKFRFRYGFIRKGEEVITTTHDEEKSVIWISGTEFPFVIISLISFLIGGFLKLMIVSRKNVFPPLHLILNKIYTRPCARRGGPQPDAIEEMHYQ